MNNNNHQTNPIKTYLVNIFVLRNIRGKNIVFDIGEILLSEVCWYNEIVRELDPAQELQVHQRSLSSLLFY